MARKRLWKRVVSMVATPRNNDETLRRAAILVSQLDADSRRQLFAHLAPREATRLRAAAASLTDVDPLESTRIIKSFVGRVTLAASSPAETNQSAKAAPAGASGADAAESDTAAGAAERHQLQFLSKVSDATLAQVVRQEHPQTVAVVLGALPADQAARLLGKLEPELRRDAVRRLGRLDTVPGDVLTDIASHLRTTVGAIEPIETSLGHRTLATILSTLGENERHSLVGDLARDDSVVAAALVKATTASTSSPAMGESTGDPQPVDQRPLDQQPVDERVATPTIAVRRDAQEVDDSFGQTRKRASRDGQQVHESEEMTVGPRLAVGLSADEEDFVRLMTRDEVDYVLRTLTPKQLRKVLGELSGRDAMLTLGGLEPQTAKRLMRVLPWKQARLAKRRIAELGPISPREVEQAQHAAALRALEIYEPESAAELLAALPANAAPKTETTAAARPLSRAA